MSLPNHILVTMRWHDTRSPDHENICCWFLNRYKQLVDPSKHEAVCLLENVRNGG